MWICADWRLTVNDGSWFFPEPYNIFQPYNFSAIQLFSYTAFQRYSCQGSNPLSTRLSRLYVCSLTHICVDPKIICAFFYDEWFIEGPRNSRLLFQCLEIMLLERQAWKFCKAKSEMQKKHNKLELPIEKKVGDTDRHKRWCAENLHNNTMDTVVARKCWPLGLWEDKSSFTISL